MTENDRLIYGGAISRMTTALERECEGRREETQQRDRKVRWEWSEGGDAERERNDRAKQTAC